MAQYHPFFKNTFITSTIDFERFFFKELMKCRGVDSNLIQLVQWATEIYKREFYYFCLQINKEVELHLDTKNPVASTDTQHQGRNCKTRTQTPHRAPLKDQQQHRNRVWASGSQQSTRNTQKPLHERRSQAGDLDAAEKKQLQLKHLQFTGWKTQSTALCRY